MGGGVKIYLAWPFYELILCKGDDGNCMNKVHISLFVIFLISLKIENIS